MKDWKAVAAGLGLEIPPDELERVVAVQARVEEVFRPLVGRIPLITEPAYVSLRFPEDSE